MTTPWWADDLVTVLHGDCLDLLPDIADGSVDAIVTDPPYGLGFMGRQWDSLPPGLPWAQQCLRVLKPGGHLLAFGGSRTWHRLAVAVEDAGFEIRDSIAWLYGSGFPKSLNVGDGRGTALKPAFEPIVVGRKPLAGTVAANVAAHGTGALNIDACRTAGDVPSTVQGQSRNAGDLYGADQRTLREFMPSPGGRWPTNVVLDDDQAAELDRQTGTLKSGGGDRSGSGGIRYDREWTEPAPRIHRADAGGASRFFPTFRYEAKAPASERPRGEDGTAHPTVKPLDLMRWLVRLVTPPGGLVLDPFAGSGTTAEACTLEQLRCVTMEREAAYLPLIRQRLARPMQQGLL